MPPNKRMDRSGKAVRLEMEDHLSPLGDPGRSVAEGARMAEAADDRKPFSMVQEACDSYEASVLPDGRGRM